MEILLMIHFENSYYPIHIQNFEYTKHTKQ
jgi:hypothetical protein